MDLSKFYTGWWDSKAVGQGKRATQKISHDVFKGKPCLYVISRGPLRPIAIRGLNMSNLKFILNYLWMVYERFLLNPGHVKLVCYNWTLNCLWKTYRSSDFRRNLLDFSLFWFLETKYRWGWSCQYKTSFLERKGKTPGIIKWFLSLYAKPFYSSCSQNKGGTT